MSKLAYEYDSDKQAQLDYHLTPVAQVSMFTLCENNLITTNFKRNKKHDIYKHKLKLQVLELRFLTQRHMSSLFV